ncbi:MAG: TetR/AcrR family transcriptional regulator [Planctomycetes bacterium]|nr:TetR/AcrR family transcriptional regulator [Planctomycetota bacterium]MCB9887719.1 TetR/AcrR family transcriptional regulator [Planctomycetota bacterium]
MQTPNPEKRNQIKAAAARLFAEVPFHEVTLERVATTAKVGKGTLYVYFASKEQLYEAVVAEGLAELVGRVEGRLQQTGADACQGLSAIVDELLGFADRYPHMFTLMRSGHPIGNDTELAAARSNLAATIERVLRAGVASGALDDPHPELTAHFVPAMVRSARLYGPADAPRAEVGRHIVQVLLRGLRPHSS